MTSSPAAAGAAPQTDGGPPPPALAVQPPPPPSPPLPRAHFARVKGDELDAPAGARQKRGVAGDQRCGRRRRGAANRRRPAAAGTSRPTLPPPPSPTLPLPRANRARVEREALDTSAGGGEKPGVVGDQLAGRRRRGDANRRRPAAAGTSRPAPPPPPSSPFLRARLARVKGDELDLSQKKQNNILKFLSHPFPKMCYSQIDSITFSTR